ncbi:hypothetical protein O3P69_017675 [Scylla paramamosain]|uniref:Uncharacterized protein n=1 Tax=Scylla paramamosain TaxID=85552 RepID=A0AAW0TXS3_SCYPA
MAQYFEPKNYRRRNSRHPTTASRTQLPLHVFLRDLQSPDVFTCDRLGGREEEPSCHSLRPSLRCRAHDGADAGERSEHGVKTRFTFTYDAHLAPYTLRVPAGFRVCRLGRAGVRHLLENAKYCGILLDLKYRMAEGVPYIGVYQDPTGTQEATVGPENLPVGVD